MVLYALASGILGWSGVSCLAEKSLHARSLEGGLALSQRLLMVLICMMGALCAWLIIDNIAACLAFSLACACMGALLVCDLREHILPTELIAVMLALAVIFRLAIGSAASLLALALPAACVAALLLLVNHMRRVRGKSELIGAGDVRMLVPLAIFSGEAGMTYGLVACALFMGIIALVQVIACKATRDTHIAFGPGLAAWLMVGTLLPLV